VKTGAMVRRMHHPDPLSVPDVDNGLQVVRWKLRGFDEMRRTQLLDRKSQFELVDGVVLHRDVGSESHDRVVAELARRLVRAYPEWEVLVDEELRWEEHAAVVVADVVVLADGIAPRLVVEVTDDTPRLAAQEKARLYARAGVEAYWHIDLAWRFLQIHRSPYDDGWGVRTSGPPDRPLPTGLDRVPELVLDELLDAADAAA
jgi:Uma2 family endonuclease